MAVNQMLPSLSETKPCGPEPAVFSGYCLNFPVFGSSRPSLFAVCPVYQSEPSGASAGSCGRECGVGTSYSLICTFNVSAVANTAMVAASVNKHRLRRDKAALLYLKIVVLWVGPYPYAHRRSGGSPTQFWIFRKHWWTIAAHKDPVQTAAGAV